MRVGWKGCSQVAAGPGLGCMLARRGSRRWLMCSGAVRTLLLLLLLLLGLLLVALRAGGRLQREDDPPGALHYFQGLGNLLLRGTGYHEAVRMCKPVGAPPPSVGTVRGPGLDGVGGWRAGSRAHR